MKTLICYASVHHGNTKKIAEAMAQAIGAELVAAKDLTTKNIDGYDLVGLVPGSISRNTTRASWMQWTLS
jgi:flavodoxin